MIEPLLHSQLEPVARRARQWRLSRALALCWGAAAAAGFSFILLQKFAGWGGAWTMPLLAVAATLTTVLVARRVGRWQPDFRQIARQIEQQHPQLHALLLTAVEQRPDPLTGKLSYLQERVVREAVAASQRHQWIETVPEDRVVLTQIAHVGALVMLVTALVGLRAVAPAPGHGGGTEAKGVTVTPGDASIERGHGLVVLARFAGPLPTEATLVVGSSPETARRLPLVKNLADPVFGGGVPEVNSNLVYRVEFAGESTREFKITVFEHPKLERADATLTFPTYTGRPEKRIEDTRRVSAVEGSKLALALQLNKPVAAARLVARDKSVVPLTVSSNRPSAALEQLPLDASQTYTLELVDAEGRTNKVKSQFVFDVLKNRAPELKISAPRGDQCVSPLEEVAFQAEAWDDFGLRAYGLSYNIGGGEAKTVVLGESTAAGEKKQFSYLLPLESLAAQTDQLIAWFVWADDVGPDGQVRRTSSDMYFAEVRPFDEIFREGQAQEGGESQQKEEQQQGNQAAKLAELQKQIINATWKLQRQTAARAPFSSTSSSELKRP